ncbi:hypothetical protein BJ508DRAFT_200847, partial [Ascobolus immersus RN42]
PSQSTSPRASSQNPGSKPAERPRLSESEKKSNHIASEQKRRMAIREGFDRLTELVPGLEGMGRSESVVLQKTVEYIRKNLEEEQELRRRVRELGISVEQMKAEGIQLRTRVISTQKSLW